MRKAKRESNTHELELSMLPFPKINGSAIQKLNQRRITLLRKYGRLHPSIPKPGILNKELHEMSYDEFQSVFSIEGFKLTQFQSIKKVTALLKVSYRDIIASALLQNKDHVNAEGIEGIRFMVPYMELVKTYCKIKKISLD